MKRRTALGEAILKHWRETRPEMVSALAKEKRLNEAVIEAQEATTDLMYELVEVRKLDYPAAWEIATTEHAFLPRQTAAPVPPKQKPRSSTRNRPRRPRGGTSG